MNIHYYISVRYAKQLLYNVVIYSNAFFALNIVLVGFTFTLYIYENEMEINLIFIILLNSFINKM